MHGYIEFRPNIWKLHSVVTHTIATMMRYFIYTLKKKNLAQPGRYLVPHSHLHLDMCRSEGRTEIVTQWWISTNWKSCGKLPKGVSYLSLLWWTLKTALHYFTWGASQKNCPQLSYYWWQYQKESELGVFENMLIWL